MTFASKLKVLAVVLAMGAATAPIPAQAGVVGSIKGAAKSVGGAVKTAAKAVGATTKQVVVGSGRTYKRAAIAVSKVQPVKTIVDGAKKLAGKR